MICKCASGGSMYSLDKNMKKVPFREAVMFASMAAKWKKYICLTLGRSNFAFAANQTITIHCTISPFLAPTI